jgi:hypothetical protein
MVWFIETRHWRGRWQRHGWPMEHAEAIMMADDLRANGVRVRVVRV